MLSFACTPLATCLLLHQVQSRSLPSLLSYNPFPPLSNCFSQSKTRDELAPAKLSTEVKKRMVKEAKNAGDKWFGMGAPEMTDKIKRDLHILANRGKQSITVL